jgi:hypothetical protein
VTGPVVVFLHGMARTHRSLARLRRVVAQAGFETWARTYPSRAVPLRELAEEVAGWIRADLGERPLLAVTHSMGGILVRHMSDALPWQGVVMLAPPNSGSLVAAHLKRSRLFRWYFGPAGQQLGDPTGWPAPPTPTGVIAGTLGPSLGNPPSWLTTGLSILDRAQPNDGTVLVSETHHPAMTDFATVEASHTWIMNHPRTQALVVHFLRYRRFGEPRLLVAEG